MGTKEPKPITTEEARGPLPLKLLRSKLGFPIPP